MKPMLPTLRSQTSKFYHWQESAFLLCNPLSLWYSLWQLQQVELWHQDGHLTDIFQTGSPTLDRVTNLRPFKQNSINEIHRSF